MHNIFKEQNKQENIDLLCAQRQLYSEAKKINITRLTISTIFALLAPILARQDGIGYYLSFFAILYFIFDLVYLKRCEQNKKISAAKIQEFFDHKVLDIKWNSVLVDTKQEAEDIHISLKKYITKNSIDSLKNWYFAEDYNLEIKLARALSQRSNISWDSTLRKTYARILTGLLSSIIIVATLIILYVDTEIGKVISFTCSLLPLGYFFLEQIIGNFETARELDSARKSANQIIEEIRNLSEADAVQKARALQDRIFVYRKSNPLVPDMVYYLYRKKQQEQMDFSLDQAVKQYISQ